MAMRSRALFRLVIGIACAAAGMACGLRLAAAQGVPAASEAEVKAAYLLKFAGFVDWPADTFSRPDEPLVIGVAGDDEIAGNLEQLASGRRVEGRPVAVRRLPETGPFTGVHVLLMGRRAEGRLRDAIASATGPVLVVTQQGGALRSGSVINFSTEGGRVRFAVSLASAESRNLKLSARLLAVAQNVEGRTP
jgi:hypothetical protein